MHLGCPPAEETEEKNDDNNISGNSLIEKNI